MKRQEVARIRERLASPHEGNVLDIGCGIGDFLSEYFGGWNKYGIEISPYARAQADNKSIHAYEDIAAIKDIDFGFDLVIWRGTFQHLDEPMRTLKTCIRLMKPGGLLVFLATPNSNSIVYKLFGDLPALDAPRNFVIPSDLMLVNILKNLGLTEIEVLKPYLGTPYASPLRDFGKFMMRLLGVKSKYAFPGNQMEVYARKA